LLILTVDMEEGYIRAVAVGILWTWRAWWTLLS
jgi:hypothetical protein